MFCLKLHYFIYSTEGGFAMDASIFSAGPKK